MRIRIKIREVIWFIVYFLASMAIHTPESWEKIASINTMMDAGKILFFAFFLFRLLAGHYTITTYDKLFILALGCMSISALLNTRVTSGTLIIVLKFFITWLIFKNIAESGFDIQKGAIHGISFYFMLFCVINTVQAVSLGGTKYGYYFLLGIDNSSASFYIFTCFISMFYYIYYSDTRRAFFETLLSFASTIFFSFYMQIGTMIVWSVATICIFIVYRIVLKNKNVNLTFLAILYGGIMGGFLYVVTIPAVSKFIDDLFFGKMHNLVLRLNVWDYFIKKSYIKPLFGYGVGEVVKTSMTMSNQRFIEMSGVTHNIIIHLFYHYGYIFFALTVIIVGVISKKSRSFSEESSIFKLLFLLFLLHGIMESGGFNYLFDYLFLLYYIDYIKEYRLQRNTVGLAVEN